MNSKRNRKCENMILGILKHGGCRIEAFDDGVYDRLTVNDSVNELLHAEKIHNKGLMYYLGAPPQHQRRSIIRKPNLKIRSTNTGRRKKASPLTFSFSF